MKVFLVSTNAQIKNKNMILFKMFGRIKLFVYMVYRFPFI